MKRRFLSILLTLSMVLALLPHSGTTAKALNWDTISVNGVHTLSFSGTHSAAITNNNELYMWGNNSYGEIGNGTKGDLPVTTPTKVLDNVSSVSLGYKSAAITKDKSLYIWGGGVVTPTKVMDNVAAVSMHYGGGAAITADGTLYTLALEDNTPTKLLTNVKTMSISIWGGAAITNDNSLYMWGENHHGEVGNGTTVEQITPVKILSDVAFVKAESDYTAAITMTGDLYEWGQNTHGETDDNGLAIDWLRPTKTMDNVVSYDCVGSGGHSTNCVAVTTDGTAYEWNSFVAEPLRVYLDNVKSVTCGGRVCLAVTTSGELYTWDNPFYPEKISDLSNVVCAESTGGFFAAITTDGNLYTWGHNLYGGVGNGSTEEQLTPYLVLENVAIPSFATLPINPEPTPSPDDKATITSLYPANGSTFDFADTSSDTRMRIFFDREVSNGGGGRPELDFSAGTLEVHKVSDDSIVYQVQYGTEVSLWNVDGRPTAVVLQNATTALDYETGYYVTMPEGFIKLADGSVSPAIEKGEWVFRTSEEVLPPVSPYTFDWKDEAHILDSVSENLVITMTALSDLTYSTFNSSDEGSLVSQYISLKKFHQMYDDDGNYVPERNNIWKVNGEGLGSYTQFYTDVIGDYTIYDYLNNANNGFYAACYQSPDGKYILSYRGSENSSYGKPSMWCGLLAPFIDQINTPNDWETDFNYVLRNKLSSQFEDALKYYLEISGKVGPGNVVLTGHSLGGALAAYVSVCTGARAYGIDGSIGHIIDTMFLETPFVINAFEGADKFNFVNLTDEFNFDLADLIQAIHPEKYPMITYASLNAKNAWEMIGDSLNNLGFGPHHPMSYLSYDKITGRYKLGDLVKVYDEYKKGWSTDVKDYVFAAEVGGSFGGVTGILLGTAGSMLNILKKGHVEIGTSENNLILPPFDDIFVRNIEFGGSGIDNLTGYANSDVLATGYGGNASLREALDGGGGADTYLIGRFCYNSVINDPAGNDAIFLHNWGVCKIEELEIQDTTDYVILSHGGRTIRINKNRNLFENLCSKISLYSIDTLTSNPQKTLLSSDIFSSVQGTQRTYRAASIANHSDDISPVKLLVLNGVGSYSIYDSNQQLISGNNTLSNENGNSTVYTEYAYYYGYNDSNNGPHSILYLFNDGYTVKASGSEFISLELYQYDESNNEIVSSAVVTNVDLSDQQSIAIVSEGKDEGFYLLDSNDSAQRIENIINTVYPQSLSIVQQTSNLKKGETVELRVTAEPYDALIDGTWYSSDTSVATVTEQGIVTAVGLGQAEISFVSINEKFAVCEINVTSSGSPSSGNYPSGPSIGNLSDSNYPISSSARYYEVAVPTMQNGTIAVTPKFIYKGTLVTLTATPDESYELVSLTVTDSKGNELELTNKGNNQYTFTMPASNVTVSATFAPISSKPTTPTENTSDDETYLFPFTDVLKTDWFCGAVEYVFNNDLMTGTAPYTFDPQGKMSRAMVWTVLGRMADADVDGSDSPWYAKAQEWATTNNVSDGTNPTNSISRQELMTMLWRYVGSPAATADLSKFSDSGTVAEWANGAMQWAVSTGLLVGDNGRLNPASEAKRCEVATIFMRFCESIVK